MSPPSVASALEGRPTQAFARRPAADTGSSKVAASSRLTCHHCGLPVDAPGRWPVTLGDTLYDTCCAGCQAVSLAIADAGLRDYYRARDLPARPANSAAGRSDATLYDDPELAARFVRTEAGLCETTLLVDGLRCGACTWLLEHALSRVPGVIDRSVNLAAERAHLRWDPSRTRLSDLIDAAAQVGFILRPFEAGTREAQIRQASRSRLRRLFVAGIGMMQVMMVAFPAYLATEGDIEPALQSLMRWASLVLTAPVVFYSAAPFFQGALREWQRRAPGMDTPVAIGIAAAFAASVWSTLTQQGEVWFDTVTMFVFLLLGARHLEWLARLRASRAIDALAAATPQSVLKLGGSDTPQPVPAISLRPGDRFLVGTGEAVAVDALLTHARGRFDVSLLTGESRPVERRHGDRIPGGAINLDAPVALEAIERQADSTLSTIARLAARAATARPPWLSLAEAIARGFTVGLLILSAVVWGIWQHIDPGQAWPIAMSVLVVSCPCALSLATPAALAAASSTALGRGMITARGDALEVMARVTDVVFDKTGTLTRGLPAVDKVELVADLDVRACLAVAAALEVSSSHPLARALCEAARGAGAPARVAQSLATHPGEGVEAMLDGRRWRLGKAAFALNGGPSTRHCARDASADHTEVWLAREGQPIARFLIADTLRDETPAVIEALRSAGLQLHLVSGDCEAVVAAVADPLGIASRRAEASPDEKLAFVRALQSQGRRVLAIGDGINDAPLLSAADTSIAVGRASTLARTSAAVVLLGDRLDDVIALRRLALRTRRIIVQNLAWALAYNLVAIPAAAFGWIAPWVAALGMSASSLVVAANALRLLEPRPTRSATRLRSA